jgi:crotonobetainyl-CoA:carnitine CoA-transferase CaiB-like acyl-CoA transferase
VQVLEHLPELALFLFSLLFFGYFFMSLPLTGLKVLDFSTLLPGPYATQLLADMGAEILRIESPTRPDLVKHMTPIIGEGKDKVSAAHASLNRNKNCMTLDLKHPKAKEIIAKLLAEYDIVIEQFRPGVMQRLGLDYDSLKQVQPKLIYCSITGYGQTGPLKDRAGHDINYLALSGLASYSGRKETGPILSGTQIADIAGGSHHAVMAIMAAHIQRLNTGEGQYLDISMSDASLALTTMFGANALASGKDPELSAEMLNGGLFYDYYQTSDQRYISIGSLEPNFAMTLLSVLGLQEWGNRLVDQSESNQQDIKAAIAEKVQEHSLAHWQTEFAVVDACVEPVLSLNEAFHHPHFIARNMIIEVEDGQGNLVKQINSALPFKTNNHKLGKPLSEDTRTSLLSLGYTAAEIDELKESQCI